MSYPISVPKHLHISSPEELKSGMPIWHVGSGGAAPVCEPSFVGFALHKHRSIDYTHEEKFIREPTAFVLRVSNLWLPTGYNHITRSMLDGNIIPNEYNHWYFCRSKKQADKLYAFLKSEWDRNPKHEQERKSWIVKSRIWDDFDYDYDDTDYDDN